MPKDLPAIYNPNYTTATIKVNRDREIMAINYELSLNRHWKEHYVSALLLLDDESNALNHIENKLSKLATTTNKEFTPKPLEVYRAFRYLKAQQQERQKLQQQREEKKTQSNSTIPMDTIPNNEELLYQIKQLTLKIDTLEQSNYYRPHQSVSRGRDNPRGNQKEKQQQQQQQAKRWIHQS